ncbi:MAG: hypothetical protein HY869_05490 [Chloroflexi bacterium]|nr:hypothetical protein [Chloroflexota bacterium]
MLTDPKLRAQVDALWDKFWTLAKPLDVIERFGFKFCVKVNMTKPKVDLQKTERSSQHFQALRQDIREEMKYRIQQRDAYSIQMTLALGALVGVAATSVATQTQSTNVTSIINLAYRALIAAPLISIYYTTLILYSYRIHRLLSKYLRDVIEPELSRLYEVPIDVEWENWYSKNAVPGIRRSFFLGSLWATCILSPLYVGFSEQWQGSFLLPLGIISALYLFVAIWVTRSFWNG